MREALDVTSAGHRTGSGVDRESNALHNEHLAEGVRPVIAAIVDSKWADRVTMAAIRKIRQEGECADYFDDWEEIRRRDGKLQASNTFAFSPISSRDKYGPELYNCLGVLFVGTDRETRREISMVAHADDEALLGQFEEEFADAFTEKAHEFKRRVVPNTTDVVLFGGQSASGKYSAGEHDYERAIDALSSLVKKNLGFAPPALTGPNIAEGADATYMYFDTSNRRAYLARKEQPGHMTNQAYHPDDIEQAQRQWSGEEEQQSKPTLH